MNAPDIPQLSVCTANQSHTVTAEEKEVKVRDEKLLYDTVSQSRTDENPKECFYDKFQKGEPDGQSLIYDDILPTVIYENIADKTATTTDTDSHEKLYETLPIQPKPQETSQEHIYQEIGHIKFPLSFEETDEKSRETLEQNPLQRTAEGDSPIPESNHSREVPLSVESHSTEHNYASVDELDYQFRKLGMTANIPSSTPRSSNNSFKQKKQHQTTPVTYGPVVAPKDANYKRMSTSQVFVSRRKNTEQQPLMKRPIPQSQYVEVHAQDDGGNREFYHKQESMKYMKLQDLDPPSEYTSVFHSAHQSSEYAQVKGVTIHRSRTKPRQLVDSQAHSKQTAAKTYIQDLDPPPPPEYTEVYNRMSYPSGRHPKTSYPLGRQQRMMKYRELPRPTRKVQNTRKHPPKSTVAENEEYDRARYMELVGPFNQPSEYATVTNKANQPSTQSNEHHASNTVRKIVSASSDSAAVNRGLTEEEEESGYTKIGDSDPTSTYMSLQKGSNDTTLADLIYIGHIDNNNVYENLYFSSRKLQIVKTPKEM